MNSLTHHNKKQPSINSTAQSLWCSLQHMTGGGGHRGQGAGYVNEGSELCPFSNLEMQHNEKRRVLNLVEKS
jgi:hypothetical protein